MGGIQPYVVGDIGSEIFAVIKPGMYLYDIDSAI